MDNSYKLHLNTSNQGHNNRKGLGSSNISPTYNPHRKYMSEYNNRLFLHCGRNGHLKKDFPTLKRSQENLFSYTRQKAAQKRGPAPTARTPKMRKIVLPH